MEVKDHGTINSPESSNLCKGAVQAGRGTCRRWDSRINGRGQYAGNRWFTRWHGGNNPWRVEFHAAHQYTVFVDLGGYLFDAFIPGWAFAVKGVANLILCLWIFLVKKQISVSAYQKI